MFEHRSYLGWITDLATDPHPHAPWPVIAVSEQLLADYAATFHEMQLAGMNEIVIWGLFVDGKWPLDLLSAVDADRSQWLHRLLDLAHYYGINVLSGLGVYSWGFDRIIAAHPQLSRGNARAMCASEPAAWDWQARVVDYVLQWPLDGISMQSADQGRCPCPACAAMGDVEYHATINARVADYVRSRRPSAIVGVNNWGLTFENPADQQYLVALGKHVDYIIDAHDTAARGGAAYRRQLIAAVPCSWGTIGGYAVEPPQHWQRDRWFLPCLASVAPHVHALAESGATACEQYFRISANPGDAVSFLVAARLLAAPNRDWRQVLDEVLADRYGPRNATAAARLADVFLRAEAAYFDNVRNLGRIGTISLEPLVGDHPGEPTYLTQHMDAAGLARYGAELTEVRQMANDVTAALTRSERMALIDRCLEGALRDIAFASARLASER